MKSDTEFTLYACYERKPDVNSGLKAENFLHIAGSSGLSLSVTIIMFLSEGDQLRLVYYKQDGINRYLALGEKWNYLAISLL